MKRGLIVDKDISEDGKYLILKVNGREVASLTIPEAIAITTVLAEILEGADLSAAAYFEIPRWYDTSKGKGDES